jgi:hypothetical protein
MFPSANARCPDFQTTRGDSPETASRLQAFPPSFNTQRRIAESFYGVSFRSISEESKLTVSQQVTPVAHLELDPDVDLFRFLHQNVRLAVQSMQRVCLTTNYKDDEVKRLISQVYSLYGEYVQTSLFIGHYTLELESPDQTPMSFGGIGEIGEGTIAAEVRMTEVNEIKSDGQKGAVGRRYEDCCRPIYVTCS